MRLAALGGVALMLPKGRSQPVAACGRRRLTPGALRSSSALQQLTAAAPDARAGAAAASAPSSTFAPAAAATALSLTGPAAAASSHSHISQARMPASAAAASSTAGSPRRRLRRRSPRRPVRQLLELERLVAPAHPAGKQLPRKQLHGHWRHRCRVAGSGAGVRCQQLRQVRLARVGARHRRQHQPIRRRRQRRRCCRVASRHPCRARQPKLLKRVAVPAGQRGDRLALLRNLEPKPGGHVRQAPGRQQLLEHKPVVPPPVSHPQRHQAARRLPRGRVCTRRQQNRSAAAGAAQ